MHKRIETFHHILTKVNDPSTVRKNTGHLTELQKPISLHLLGIIVSRQYSKSSDVGIYRVGTLLPEIISLSDAVYPKAHFALLCTSATGTYF